MKRNEKAIQQRLARVEGQVRGVRKMIEEDRYCVDVLNQTTAIRSALAQVELLVLEDHSDHCVEAAKASPDPEAHSGRSFGNCWGFSRGFAGDEAR